MALSSLLLAALVPYGPAPVPPSTSPVPVEDEPTDEHWHGFVEAGGTYTDGNTDVRTARVAAEAIKRIEDDRYTTRAFWNYTRSGGEITERNAGINGKWDHFIDEKLYYNGIAGVETDQEADLDLRYYAGAGAGYQIRDDEKVKLYGEAGLVYFTEEFDDGSDNSYISARVSYDLDYTVSETTLFEQIAEAFPSVENASDFNGRLDSKLSLEIKENWSAYIQHILDFDNTPAVGADRIDNRVVVGLRWTY